MNTILIFLIAVPAIEIYLMIKIGQNIGAFTTISLVFVTAFLGIYFARLEGLNTLKSGIYNLYKNKVPLFEMMSGASIAIAALLLIIPGFLTDFFGFVLLLPFTRKLIINYFFKKKDSIDKKNNDFIEGEIIDKDSEKKDEL